MYPLLMASIFAVIPAGLEQDAGDNGGAETQTLWHEMRALTPTTVLIPENYDAEKATTLVVALHGWGSSAESFQAISEPFLGQGYLVALPESAYVFPVGEGQYGFDWSLHHTGNNDLQVRATKLLVTDQLPAMVNDITSRYKISRVIVLGFSQGACIAFLAAIYNPTIFSGIVSFGLPVLDPSWFPGNSLAEARSIPVLLIHGESDERAPHQVSEDTQMLLEKLGYRVMLSSFSGGHSVPQSGLQQAVQWTIEVGASMALPK